MLFRVRCEAPPSAVVGVAAAESMERRAVRRLPMPSAATSRPETDFWLFRFAAAAEEVPPIEDEAFAFLSLPAATDADLRLLPLPPPFLLLPLFFLLLPLRREASLTESDEDDEEEFSKSERVPSSSSAPSTSSPKSFEGSSHRSRSADFPAPPSSSTRLASSSSSSNK